MKRTIRNSFALMACLAAFAVLPLAAQNRGMSVVAGDGSTLASFSNSYALVIGESRYTNGWPNLPGVSGDTAAVKRLLEEQGFSVETLENVTSRDLRAGIENFLSRHGYNRDVRLLIYYAGHGHTLKLDNTRDMGYIVPSDAPVPSRDETGFKRLAIAMQQFDTWSKQIESRHVLFMFDSCFSGSIFATSRAAPGIIDYKIANPVRQFISSGGANETVPDTSIFRRQLEAALRGREADYNKDGYVSGSELGDFLQSTVVNYSNNSQHPQYGKIRDPDLDKGDFVFEVGRASPAVTAVPAAPPPQSVPEGAALVLGGRHISLPRLFSVNTLGTYKLGRGETVERVLINSTRTAYSLIYRTGFDYYVRQGNRSFGPFPSIDYDNRTWYAKNRQGQYFVGSAGITNGPISDPGIAEIFTVMNIDDRRLAYTADIANGQYILQTGLKREGPYDELGNIGIAPVTGKIAYTYTSNQRKYLMIDGKSLGPFDRRSVIGWSPDGQKCAYAYFEENSGYTFVYGGYSYTSPEWLWLDGSFASDGTFVFAEGTTLHQVSNTGVDKKINAHGKIRNWHISSDGKNVSYSYINTERPYVVTLVRPDGRQRTYGPFENWPNFYFLHSSENFYCAGKEAATGRQVIYVNDEKHAAAGDWTSPVFSAQENKYAAYLADIDGMHLLHTDVMTVEIILEMESTVLPEGTPVYWTRKDDGTYLNISYDSYGPFDYAANMSDDENISWLVYHDGSIEIISVKR